MLNVKMSSKIPYKTQRRNIFSALQLTRNLSTRLEPKQYRLTSNSIPLRCSIRTNRLNLEVMINNTLACAFFKILLYCKLGKELGKSKHFLDIPIN